MEQDPEKSPKKQVNNYIKYSAVGFQMMATIGLLTFIGYKIDASRNAKTPYFTAGFSLLGVIVGILQVVRQLNSDK